MNQVATTKTKDIAELMAADYGFDRDQFVNAIKSTAVKGQCSNEQFTAFLMVAREYKLNPLTKEIYAYPDRGGIQPIVSIDGWMNLINSNPAFDGMEFEDIFADGKLSAIKCTIFRKDRAKPISVTEYLAECKRNSEPWNKWPARMLRHKSAIQAARYAFGFAGIMDDDEYERLKDVTPSDKPTAAERYYKATEKAVDAQEGFSATIHAESETITLDGEIIDAVAVDVTNEETVSEDKGQVIDVSVMEPNELDSLEWLQTAAKHLLKATNPKGEYDTFKISAASIKNVYPAPDGFIESYSSDKMKKVYNLCSQVVKGEIDTSTARKLISAITALNEQSIKFGASNE
jgi:phage recombination protein Bet